MHDFRGEIWLGPSIEKTVKRVLNKLDRGEALTEEDKRDYYNAYESLVHESLHAAAPIAEADYNFTEHKVFEETLTEELAHLVLAERLRAQGLTDVLSYAKRNPGSIVVAGTYPAYRAAFDSILSTAKIAPELRADYLFDRKGESVTCAWTGSRQTWLLLLAWTSARRTATSPPCSPSRTRTSTFGLATSRPSCGRDTDLAAETWMDWQGQRLHVGSKVRVRWNGERWGEIYGIENGAAMVHLEDGRFLSHMQPEEITGVEATTGPATIVAGGKEIGPDDLIEYDNIADGSISEARVTRVLNPSRAHLGDAEGWVVEAVTTERSKKPGQVVLLTPKRVGEHFAPVEAEVVPIRPEPEPVESRSGLPWQERRS